MSFHRSARRGEAAGHSGRQSCSVRGYGSAEGDCAFCRGLPSVYLDQPALLAAPRSGSRKAVTHCLCAQSSTRQHDMQVIFFTHSFFFERSQAPRATRKNPVALRTSETKSPAVAYGRAWRQRVGASQRGGAYPCGVLAFSRVAGGTAPGASSPRGSGSTRFRECRFTCCGPSAHCGTCRPTRAS